MQRSLQAGFESWQHPSLDITEPFGVRGCYDNDREAFDP
jgi:hypothetical protein